MYMYVMYVYIYIIYIYILKKNTQCALPVITYSFAQLHE